MIKRADMTIDVVQYHFMTKMESMYAPKKRYWMKQDSFGAAVKSFPRARYMSVIFSLSTTAGLRATASLMK